MKSIYNENLRIKKEVLSVLVDLLDGPTKQAFNSLTKRGYSPRELSHAIQTLVVDEELDRVLGLDKY